MVPSTSHSFMHLVGPLQTLHSMRIFRKFPWSKYLSTNLARSRSGSGVLLSSYAADHVWAPRTIHKPCTDGCSDTWFLRIEPVTIEKHVDLAFPIFERILFFCKAYYLLEAVPIIPVYVSEQTFLIFVRKRCSYAVVLDTFCVVSVAPIGFVYISTPILSTWVTCPFSTCFSMAAGSIHNHRSYRCMVCG